MSPSSLLASLLLLLLVFAMMCGFVGSWVWVTLRVRAGRPIVPSLRESTRPVPWSLGSVVLVILSWFVVNLSVVTSYSLVTQGNGPVAKAADRAVVAVNRSLGFTEQLVVVSIINAVLLVLVPLILRATSGARLSDLGLFRRGLSRQIAVGMMGFFLVSPFVYALNALAVQVWKPESHPLEKMVRQESALGIAELAVLSAVLLAPMAEELIFRGVLQRWLSRLFHRLHTDDPAVVAILPPSEHQELPAELAESSREPAWTEATPEAGEGSLENPYAPPVNPVVPPANPVATLEAPSSPSFQPIVMTSLLFAAVHFPQWPAPLGIFVLALGLGYILQQSGSLIAAMVMHALFNGLATFILLLMVQIGGLPDQAPKPAQKGAPPPPGCIAVEQTTTGSSRQATTRSVQHFWDH